MTIRRPGGLIEEELTSSIIGAFFAVHRHLGFGFLEQIYASALEIELRERGHDVARQFGAIVRYKGIEIAYQRLDMIVDNKVIVEIKSTEKLHRDAARQLFNYLRATTFEVGLLLHFGRDANFSRVVYETARLPNRSCDPGSVAVRNDSQTGDLVSEVDDALGFAE
jgi:GxxExxY protein